MKRENQIGKIKSQYMKIATLTEDRGEHIALAAGEVARAFPEGLEMILDGGMAPGGVSSTVLDLSRTPPQVLREGLLPLTALRPFLQE